MDLKYKNNYRGDYRQSNKNYEQDDDQSMNSSQNTRKYQPRQEYANYQNKNSYNKHSYHASQQHSHNNKRNQYNPHHHNNCQTSDEDNYADDYKGCRQNKNDNYNKKMQHRIDSNGHNNNHVVFDQQFDRSKGDHYYNKNDIKFRTDKAFYNQNQIQNRDYCNGQRQTYEFHDQQQNNQEQIIEQANLPISHQDILISNIQNNFEFNQLYNCFKKVEKICNFQYQKDEKKVIIDKSDMDCLFLQILQQISRLLILKDLEFASQKKIDQRVWDIYKKRVEQQKRYTFAMKDQQEYLWIFDFKIKYLRQILTEVKANYKNVFETEIIIDNQSRRIIANEFCYFGEIIELKDKIQKNYCENSNKNNQLIAAQQYYNALKLYPFNGKFYFVLATLNKLNEDDFSAIYYCIRALYSVQGFQCKEKLQEFLEQTRLKCIQFEKENNNYGFIQVENYFKMFVLHFYSYTNIVLTKISIESIKSHCIMFKYLQNHIQYLLTQISQEKLEKECILLQFIVNIIIFTLNKFQEHIQEINDLSVKILEQNQIASECLKFTYGLLNHIFELYTVDPNKYSINLVLPILYYFIENQVIAEYLFSKYPGQMSLFNIILQKTQKKFDQIIQNFQTEEIDFEELASNYLNDLEMDIIGYKPLYSYFEKYKKKKLVLGDINLMFPVKLFIIKTQMEKIKSFVKQEEGQNIQNEEELEDDFQQLFFMNKNKIIPQKKLLIIIDGMNVAIRFGQSQFSSKGIQIAVDFWIKHNADVHVFLPDFCFSQDQIEKKRNKDKQELNIKIIPDEIDTLIKLKEKGLAIGIPNWNYDDSYMIDYARKKDAFILTNDRYNDHINYYNNDPKKRELVKQWIRNNCISFTFVKDELQPDPDFMEKRTNIKLNMNQQK